MVNSSHIREYASQFNTNIWQVPSIVDTDKFVYRPFPLDGRVCVGWSGSPTTLKNIKMLETPLQRISASGKCDIHFIGGTDFGLKDVKYTAQKWDAETEVEDLRKMQIGLVPLPNVSWNPHKFIMKTAQYMALGIVPVGTSLASNPEVIRHGENGFLADNDSEWVEYIDMLVTDRDLRDRLSRAAANDAEAKYSLKANEAKIVAAFKAALN
jgi:glycosyltransferase involved in cell wall biosynthesis